MTTKLAGLTAEQIEKIQDYLGNLRMIEEA